MLKSIHRKLVVDISVCLFHLKVMGNLQQVNKACRLQHVVHFSHSINLF